MLTLTETAVTVVKSIVNQDPTVTDGALRIHHGQGTDRDFEIAVVADGQPGDAVVESAGARVFVAESATAVLDDKTLDAEVGENGAVTFALIPQA